MSDFKLSSDDLEQIKNIERTCLWIESIYNKLFFLDRTGKKESEEYKKLLEELKNATEIEKMQYNMASFTPLKACLLLKEIGFSSLKVKNLEDVISLNFHNKSKKRIYNRLYNILYTSPDAIINFIFNVDTSDLSNEERKIISSSSQIVSSLEKDMLTGFLMLISESFNEEKNLNVRNSLIESMYYLSFVNQDVEKSMINSFFESQEYLYVSTKLNANLFQFDTDLYEDFLRNTIFSKILSLLSILDGQYKSESVITTSVLNECLIRTCLILSEKNSNRYIKEICDLLDNLERNNKLIYREKSCALIYSCFEKMVQDKNKVRYISLGNR